MEGFNLDLVAESKILILDDNRTNNLLLEKLLNNNGYRNVKSILDSRLAVETYQSYMPDLLLLDLRMPYYNGFEILQQLSEIKGADYLSVIVITAENDRNNLLKALELGAKDFIEKPFDQSEVLMRIRNMLEIRLLHKQGQQDNLLLERKVLERTKELDNMQTELFNRLLRAAEFRDNDTGKHISRIGHYVYRLAILSGSSEEYAMQLYYASMMHDIGKIGVPDYILLKPGKLTEPEFEKMKMHTVKGGEILSGSSLTVIKLAEQIALTHHERWDGKGYPLGLKGEGIPLAGRITAIFDVFDSLVSNRPYKFAWSEDDAVKEIKEG